MKTVAELLQGKGYDIWSVAPDDTVLDALKLMADKNTGAVLVLTDGNLAGILSERDFARKVALEGITAKETRVREIMTPKSDVCAYRRHCRKVYGPDDRRTYPPPARH